jgi:hypothetical protein
MEAEEIRYFAALLPFHVMNLDEGMKYLGFYLKPNNHRKADWLWLIAKLEKWLQVWSHKWLSQAGRLVLIKSMLEAIPIYWMSFSWIPKGILEKDQKICFSYL